jgi:hypothetical protein
MKVAQYSFVLALVLLAGCAAQTESEQSEAVSAASETSGRLVKFDWCSRSVKPTKYRCDAQLPHGVGPEWAWYYVNEDGSCREWGDPLEIATNRFTLQPLVTRNRLWNDGLRVRPSYADSGAVAQAAGRSSSKALAG